MQTFWTIVKLSVPNKFLEATCDDAPETNSERKFRIRSGIRESFGVDPNTGRRLGLRTALRELQTVDVATT
jgi:NADPH-dependent stearoyl-CoA 9-desaturase